MQKEKRTFITMAQHLYKQDIIFIYTDKYNHPHIHITETVSWVKNRNPKVKNKYVAIITPPKYPRSVRDVPLNQEALYCLKLMEQHYFTGFLRYARLQECCFWIRKNSGNN